MPSTEPRWSEVEKEMVGMGTMTVVRVYFFSATAHQWLHLAAEVPHGTSRAELEAHLESIRDLFKRLILASNS